MPVHVLDSLPGGDFDSYRIPPNQEDGSLQGRLLIQVAASGRLEDHFRIVFGGGQHPSVSFSGRKISTHPIFGPYNFHLEADPENVDIKTNAFVSKWEDLESMVASDRLAVSTEELQDANQHFREAWEAAKKTSRPRRPAALVCTGELSLRLQASSAGTSGLCSSSTQGRQAGQGYHQNSRACSLDSGQPNGQRRKRQRADPHLLLTRPSRHENKLVSSPRTTFHR